jgi:hypothetical protein
LKSENIGTSCLLCSLKSPDEIQGSAIQQIVKESQEQTRNRGHLLLCLSKLQPEFYKKEVKMILQDNKEVAERFFSKSR